MFGFPPESCSPSARNAVRFHPGILFDLDRNRQQTYANVFRKYSQMKCEALGTLSREANESDFGGAGGGDPKRIGGQTMMPTPGGRFAQTSAMANRALSMPNATAKSFHTTGPQGRGFDKVGNS